MNHSVADHPQSKLIAEMLLKQVPLRKIAESVTPKVSAMALQRYKVSVLQPAARALALTKSMENVSVQNRTAQAVQALPAVQPYVARMMKHAETVDAHMAALEPGAGAKEAAALISADVKAQELAMRATGLLDSPAGHQTSITIVCPAGGNGAPEITVEPDAVTIDIGPTK